MDGKKTGGWAGYGAISLDGETLVWRPNFDVAQHLYQGFELRLADLCGDGIRLIRPAGGFFSKDKNGRVSPSPFFYDARLGGLAISEARGLDAERRRAHDTSFFYAEKLLNSRALLKRRFTGPADFRIGDQMRKETGRWSVVPADLDGKPLGIRGLMKLGHKEATRQLLEEPTREQLVHLGLYAAARTNPLPPESFGDDAGSQKERLRRLVRSALLDTDLAPDDITEQELEIISERFADAVDPHLGDDRDDFRRWFDGPKSTLVKQIAKRKKAKGGERDSARVFAALAEQGWRGLLLAAECIEIQMRAVAANLPEPLSAADLARYKAVYSRQPWLGGLSLCMLWGRFDFLREAIWDVIERPGDPVPVGTLLRLLQYYADAAPLRRDVDRQRKRKVRRSRGVAD